MTPRPDSHSFTKFVISAGAFLVVAAFVVPGLILRDTGVLTIPRGELEEFTPTARHELERRQGIAHNAGSAAPFLGGALLVAGTLLIAFGIPRLKQQEKTADEHAKAEVDKLHRELSPQTPSEEIGRAETEIEEQQPKPVAATRPPQRRPPADTGATPRAKQLQLWRKAETKVLERLAEIAAPRYELQSKIRLGGASSQVLLLDALLISQIDQLPDIVVEIKVAGPHLSKNIGNRMAEAESQLLRYLSRYRRNSVGWLIFYADEELSPAVQERIERRAADLRDLLKVSIVTADSLKSLVLPVDG
ncbi:MAG TPA: hypothetical protein VNS60_05710 [Solirubrobacterales bacterium]|nr:hypothetical protein [Solirubrobacterales bacterium]